MSEPSRRELFVAAGALSLAAASACTPPADRGTDRPLDSDPGEDTDPPGPPWCEVEAGTEAEGWTPVRLSDHPGLDAVGGSTSVTLGGERVNIAHVEEGCFVAMGTVCTHEGCAVEVRDNPGPRFVCPCHGALYDWEGQPVAGPAPDPLPTWPAALRDGSVWVLKP